MSRYNPDEIEGTVFAGFWIDHEMYYNEIRHRSCQWSHKIEEFPTMLQLLDVCWSHFLGGCK